MSSVPVPTTVLSMDGKFNITYCDRPLSEIKRGDVIIHVGYWRDGAPTDGCPRYDTFYKIVRINKKSLSVKHCTMHGDDDARYGDKIEKFHYWNSWNKKATEPQYSDFIVMGVSAVNPVVSA